MNVLIVVAAALLLIAVWYVAVAVITSAPRQRLRTWRPGPDYLVWIGEGGGEGGWVLDSRTGEEIWSTDNIEFDRWFWAEFGFREPRRWVDSRRQ